MTKNSFGDYIREKRVAKKISLRKFAAEVGVSPTYISQIERGEFKPPIEERVKRMAILLGESPEELMALAQRMPSDLSGIIQKHPMEVATFLRSAEGFSKEDWQDLTKKIQNREEGNHGDKS